jgi:hypothetical protein
MAALVWWLAYRPDLQFPGKAFWRTLAGSRHSVSCSTCCLAMPFSHFKTKPAMIRWEIPAVGGWVFHTAQLFINWRAFTFTFFLVLLISLLREVTLALPYGWWEYRPGVLTGLHIGVWSSLPIEGFVFGWL